MSTNNTVTMINRLNKDIADIHKKISDEQAKETKASNDILRIQGSVNKNTSQSTLKSKMNQISKLKQDISKSVQKRAELQKRLASKSSDLSKQQLQLTKYQDQERKKQDALAKKQEAQQLEYQRSITRELESQRRAIKSTANLSGFSQSEVAEEFVEQPTYDVFISHASEDKDEFVRPLAEELIKIGVNVWYDEFSLKWGDSLRVSIDRGLANSKFGVVVISTHFIKKKWPEYEVNGLVAREMNGENVILPVWHNVTKSEVIKYSPTLADKLAMNSSVDSLEDIAKQLKSLL